MAAQAASDLYITTVTKAEILYGISLLPVGKRRTVIEAAATAMFDEEFAGRLLSFGPDAAGPYARIAAARRATGRPISHFDAQIAAIAHTAGATVATRNTQDFVGCAINLVDPWR